MIAKATKILLTIIQSQKGRKVLKNTLLIILSPLILITLFLVSGADGASKHNHQLIDVAFLGHEMSSSTPVEYAEYVNTLINAFDKVEHEINTLEVTDGQLDSIFIKSVLFVAYVDQSVSIDLNHLNVPDFVSCFYTKETLESDTQNQVNEFETLTIIKPIASTHEMLQNASNYLDMNLLDQQEIFYEIYRVALTGVNRDLDEYVALSVLLQDVYTTSAQTSYIGGEFGSPFKEGWRQYVTSEFGPRDSIILPDGSITGDYHNGIDFGRPTGTPIQALGNGKVVLVRYTNIGLGFYCVIDHGGGVISVYGHLSRIHVTENQEIVTGQIIGDVGSTGYSTGPHLHLEIIRDRKNVNPRNYLK